jgi:hypothetical protein
MPTTVKYYLPEFTQGTIGDASGLTLKLSKTSDQSAVNGSGDSLVWAGEGWVTAVVAENWTEQLAVTVVDADGLVPRAGWLGVGSVVVSDVRAELDSSASAKLARIEAVVSGTLSGAGTSTEIFVGPSATVTVTVDADGNRSAVVVT